MRSEPSDEQQYRLNGLQLQFQDKMFVVEQRIIPSINAEGKQIKRLWLGFMFEGQLRWCPERKILYGGDEKVVAISCSTYRRQKEVEELSSKSWKGVNVKYTSRAAPPDFSSSFKHLDKFQELAKGLNSIQRQAVDSFLRAPYRLHLLQGPPGTGKSRVISTLLRMLMLLPKSEGTILVCAPTNQAVQLLCKAFLKTCGRQHSCCYVGVNNKIVVDTPNFSSSGVDDLQVKDVFADRAQACLLEKMTDILQSFIESKKMLSSIGREEGNVLVKRSIKKVITHIDFLKLYAPHVYYGLEVCAGTMTDHTRKHVDIDGRKCLAKLETLHDSSNPDPGEVEDMFTAIITLIKKAVRPKEFEEEMIKNARVIFVTVDSAGKRHLRGLAGDKVRWCVVDEAGQSVEASTLNVLAWQPRKLLLVGDPHQLSATVISTQAEKAGYSQSLMGRMLKLNRPHFMLQQQYRMHPEIVSFPNESFYGGKLTNGPNVQLYGRGPLENSYIVVDVSFGQEERGVLNSLQNISGRIFTVKFY